MYVYLYTLPFDPRFFLWADVEADVYDVEGILFPFDCTMDVNTGFCYPSREPCVGLDVDWCLSSPVWNVCSWSDVDDGNFAAQCALTTDLMPIGNIVPTFSDDGEVDGFHALLEEPGVDTPEDASAFYGDARPVVVRAAYVKIG